MLITIKFGGTSVGRAERIGKAARIVADEVSRGNRVVVVTSAMSGVTNRLVEVLEGFQKPTEEEADQVSRFFQFAKQLERAHVDAAREAIRDPEILEATRKQLYAGRHDLERVLLGSHFLGELTPIGYDFVVSTGERLCVPVLAGAVQDLGVDGVALGGHGARIATDNNYGNARPHLQRTRDQVRETLLPILDAGRVPVCPGFYGVSSQGRIATLGRGGSDYSATLIGCALDADEIWTMTDVDGIKPCDPRIVPAARTIESMPYAVAAEMAMLGAKVLHQKSVAPAAGQRVPLRIASSFEPEKPGTLLIPAEEGGAPKVWTLTLVQGGLVRLQAGEHASCDDLNSQAFHRIEQSNIELLASAIGQSGRSFLALAAGESFKRLTGLAREIASSNQYIQCDVHQPVAVLGVVGQNVATQSEVLSKVAGCIAPTGADILAVLQGASPHSLVFAMRIEDQTLRNVMQTLHTQLGLD